MKPLIEKYDLFFNNPGFEDDESLCLKVPLKKITLIITPCFGYCPDYEVTLYCNGTASYNGGLYAKLHGQFNGEFNLIEFGKLCYFIEKYNITGLDEAYSVNWTDDTSTILEITDNEENLFRIEDYGNNGPIELWTVHQIIKAIIGDIFWSETKRIL